VPVIEKLYIILIQFGLTKSKTTGATCRTWTAYPSGADEFNPGF